MHKIQLTAEQYNNIKFEAAKYQSIRRIAAAVNINPHTFQTLLKTDPMVKFNFNEGRKIAVDLINNHLSKKLAQGDTKTILFLAEKFAGITEELLKEELIALEQQNEESKSEDREKTEKLRALFLEFVKSKNSFEEWLKNKEDFAEYLKIKKEYEN